MVKEISLEEKLREIFTDLIKESARKNPPINVNSASPIVSAKNMHEKESADKQQTQIPDSASHMDSEQEQHRESPEDLLYDAVFGNPIRKYESFIAAYNKGLEEAARKEYLKAYETFLDAMRIYRMNEYSMKIYRKNDYALFTALSAVCAHIHGSIDLLEFGIKNAKMVCDNKNEYSAIAEHNLRILERIKAGEKIENLSQAIFPSPFVIKNSYREELEKRTRRESDGKTESPKSAFESFFGGAAEHADMPKTPFELFKEGKITLVEFGRREYERKNAYASVNGMPFTAPQPEAPVFTRGVPPKKKYADLIRTEDNPVFLAFLSATKKLLDSEGDGIGEVACFKENLGNASQQYDRGEISEEELTHKVHEATKKAFGK